MLKLVLIATAGLAVAGVVVLGMAWFFRSVETPDYVVSVADGDFELREYPTMVVASVDRDGDRQGAVRRAFSSLAGYIFAKDRPGEKIAMTAPVTQTPSRAGWTVSFIMPAGRSVEELPVPGGDVRLAAVASRVVAAVRFSGRWTDTRFEEQAARLREWVSARGLQMVGDVEYAYYNDPFTPAFLRRNEILVEVARS